RLRRHPDTRSEDAAYLLQAMPRLERAALSHRRPRRRGNLPLLRGARLAAAPARHARAAADAGRTPRVARGLQRRVRLKQPHTVLPPAHAPAHASFIKRGEPVMAVLSRVCLIAALLLPAAAAQAQGDLARAYRVIASKKFVDLTHAFSP